MSIDFGKQYHMDMEKAKTPSRYIFCGKKYRISVISNSLIRFEYSEEGKFNDYPTFFAKNRSFATPKITVNEDSNILAIKTDTYVLEYLKEKPFISSKLLPDANLRILFNNSDKSWHFNHPEARNLKGCNYGLDDIKKQNKFNKSLLSLDGFTSYDDSHTPIIDSLGNIVKPNFSNIDTYLFVYGKDLGLAMKDYLKLTGMPPLIPKYALGLWWNKNESYNEESIKELVSEFKKNNVPLSVLLFGESIRKDNFSIDNTKIKNIKEFKEYMNTNNIKVGMDIKTNVNIKNTEDTYEVFKKIYGKSVNGDIPVNVYDPNFMNAFLNVVINSLVSITDFLWINDKNENNNITNHLMNYYIFNYYSMFKDKRNFILSRNNNINSHSLGALYSGNTSVSFKTLKLLPSYNTNASNECISWWSHDIGGFKNGIEDEELYMRYVQLGVFSPIFRLSSEKGKYYKRKPWKWDTKTNKIASDYIRLRYRLIPYIYSEAYKYSTVGSPIIQPLYYKRLELLDEPLYKNEYHFGSQLLICPITDVKDSIMNRVVHRIYLPEGTWYDYKTGKKFSGNKRYTMFYKDEEYPIFAKSGAIIVETVLDSNNINDLSNPNKLLIQVFPGKNNSYSLYEDDGYTNMYKEGNNYITQIDYTYSKDKYNLVIYPTYIKQNIIPDKRDYIIKLKNVKSSDKVKVLVNEKSIDYKCYTQDNDFVIEFNGIKTTDKIEIICEGKDIEINSMRLFDEDLESIIQDVRIDTTLKEKIDEILFSDSDIKHKRINIRKLKRDGLDSIFVKMFMKLLDYMSEL